MKDTPTLALRAKLDIVHALCKALDIEAQDVYCYSLALEVAETAKEVSADMQADGDDTEGMGAESLLQCSREDRDEVKGEGCEILDRAIEFAEAYKL